MADNFDMLGLLESVYRTCLLSMKKSNPHYTRGFTPKRVTSGSAKTKYNEWQCSEETQQSDFTGAGNEAQTSRTDSDVA